MEPSPIFYPHTHRPTVFVTHILSRLRAPKLSQLPNDFHHVYTIPQHAYKFIGIGTLRDLALKFEIPCFRHN